MILIVAFPEGSKEQLKEHLIDELDYVLLPREAWDKLVSWYDIVEGQVNHIMHVVMITALGVLNDFVSHV